MKTSSLLAFGLARASASMKRTTSRRVIGLMRFGVGATSPGGIPGTGTRERLGAPGSLIAGCPEQVHQRLQHREKRDSYLRTYVNSQ